MLNDVALIDGQSVPYSSAQCLVFPLLSIYGMLGPCGGAFFHSFYDQPPESKVSKQQ